MKITITGRHMHVHDSVKEYAIEKTSKLERYNDALQHIEIVVANEGDRKLVEMIATSRVGGKHVGQVEHEDIFAAIDLLFDKMKRQLEKTKEPRRTASTAPRAAALSRERREQAAQKGGRAARTRSSRATTTSSRRWSSRSGLAVLSSRACSRRTTRARARSFSAVFGIPPASC